MATEACCVPAPHLRHASIGQEERWGDIRVYVSCATNAKEAVILVSDIFGWVSPLLRKLADKVADAGYVVVVPDLLHGNPFKPSETGSPFSTFPAWIKDHEPGQAMPDCNKIIQVLNSRGITSIGIAGFCWGAKVAALLARENGIKAAVLLHPSFVTVEDIKEIQAPVAILAAEIDQGTPPSVIEEFRAILASRPEVECYFKLYPGTAHGWTVRYDMSNEKAVQQADEAHQDMLSWFWRFLK